ncbi:hypothetical protein Q2317_25505, partial [Escherichia coli]|nr:hypothetical protein [Escherichia coli]
MLKQKWFVFVRELAHRLVQTFLGVGRAVVGDRTAKNYAVTSHSPALGDQSGATVRRHVLQNLKGHGDIERLIWKRQWSAAIQDDNVTF